MILGNLASSVGNVVGDITGLNKPSKNTITGSVVIVKKNVLDFTAVHSTVADSLFELLGNQVSLQLVSAENPDPANENGGKLGKLAALEYWNLAYTPLLAGDDSLYKVSFEWDEEFGIPGAIILRNNHTAEFFLKTITLENVTGEGRIHFVCNFWVYPDIRYKKPRIFFSNKTYLPHEKPAALREYREEELQVLRGDGTGQLKTGDRVYDYAYCTMIWVIPIRVQISLVRFLEVRLSILTLGEEEPADHLPKQILYKPKFTLGPLPKTLAAH
ncbi:hypothetical protein E1A91_D08G251900v1 [Gossypium mustelinum]|uniref:PLAT domain-containing protein n=1 Tax=Gossypium mustelinum TaxID=34275 RepID=A0A5D2U1T7_GOSMU|nr:hypothetical protein E1A91_D08G251900v1 [Gossypium mustelinum]